MVKHGTGLLCHRHNTLFGKIPAAPGGPHRGGRRRGRLRVNQNRVHARMDACRGRPAPRFEPGFPAMKKPAPRKRTASQLPDRPDRDEALKAVRTLIRWAGDDPDREGLLETPDRVVRSYEEFFSGYRQDPAEILAKTFSEVDGYDEMIVMNDIRFESH